MKTSNSPAQPLFSESTARRLALGAFVFLVLVQIVQLAWIGNGLMKRGDPHGDADALRSGEAYWKEGLTSYHGLPRMLYGNRFPTNGTVISHVDATGRVPERFRHGFPERLADPDAWVYTHQPPGPNLLCGVSALFLGFDPIWKLRLLPIGLGLAAIAIFFKSLARAFGSDRGALIAVACALLPLISTFMPALHYEGYSFAFLFLQFSVLIRLLWKPAGRSLGSWVALFLLGLLQGYFCFDLCFVVVAAVVPLWLMRRAEGGTTPFSWLVAAMALPFSGFCLAHGLHFLQVVAELGGWQPALNEFRNTAAERAGIADQLGVLGNLKQGFRFYLRESLKMHSLYFGPFLLLAFVAALPMIFCRQLRVTWATWQNKRGGLLLAWPGERGVTPALAAAFFVSLLWLLVMPQHTAGNAHLTFRHFFLFYLCLVLVLAKSVSLQREHHSK